MISSVGPTAVTPLLLPERPYGYDDFDYLGAVRSAPVVLFTAADSPVDSAGLVTLTPELLTAIESGKLRPLASGSHERPAYLPDVPTFYEVIGLRSPDPTSEPDYTIDTAFSAPEFIGDAKAATLSSTLSQCLSTDNVQRDIGAEFIMPADQGEPWEQGERYRKLATAVQHPVEHG